MAETPELTYAALITISLPGQGKSVSMTVTLSPGDLVTTGGWTKPLGECTLADLRRYADELEADVWETYQQITLPELDADEQIEVVVTLPGEEADSLADWPKQVLITPEEESPQKTSPEPSSEATAAEEPADTESEAAESDGEDEQAKPVEDSQQSEEAGEGDLAAVAVAEAEEVFPDVEASVVEQEPIIPSQARVRVAGGRLPLGDPTWAAVDILLDEPALRAAQAHALSSMNREVAGVLVGRRPEKQPDGRYLVHIFDTIIAKHTVMQGASVTYTPESWRYLNDTLNERYPDETAVMVGWYHTHPGFGIFLSGMDLFIHQNFFTQIWHVAMVLDPQARTSGFFCWDRPKSRVSRFDFAWPSWASGSW